MELVQEDSRELDGARIEGDSVQASPNLRKAWSFTQVADYLRRRRIHLLHMEEAGSRWGPAVSSTRAVGGGTESAGRIQHEEDEDSRLDQAYPGRALRGNRTRQLSDSRRQRHAKERERGEWRRWNWQTERAVTKTGEKMKGQAAKCLGTSQQEADANRS